MKTNKKYLFWYKSSATTKTEFIYIYALTPKQATYFFSINGYTRYYDYSYHPIGQDTDSEAHEVGTMFHSWW